MKDSDDELMSAGQLRMLKHDIKNQLSGIIISAEQLRYELSEPSSDCLFYLDTINKSCEIIDSLLNGTKK